MGTSTSKLVASASGARIRTTTASTTATGATGPFGVDGTASAANGNPGGGLNGATSGASTIGRRESTTLGHRGTAAARSRATHFTYSSSHPEVPTQCRAHLQVDGLG